ncbi:TetR/AcrR family transcriptional regulator [Tsukamurella paurometabola]|uniref:Bacterial regulatory proteins, tetR family n=3 Tax=Tsukamurella paurometabola TaxID=2061 RepID=A0A3P8KCU4_TSUPA|nr:TetR/AcrR family transcriptional regulator [Tsukamurella paurometabola]UEA84861.1 TetR/AcrR family transcriptional regulator [Tsukamurella paurometabola]VDR37448.1 Bacterial regulatory proteins, tetR family [Tsukamurella paurometabola]
MESLLTEPSDKRRRRTRAALLDAARALYARPQGYRGTSVDELAAAADVALTSIYSNFPGGKADLYAVLACRIGREHVAAMAAAVGTATGADAARLAFDEYLDFHRREPMAFRLLGLTDVHGEGSETVRAARREVRGYLSQALELVIGAVGEPAGPARAEVIQCWAGINGLLALAARGLIGTTEAEVLIADVRRRSESRLEASR